MSEQPCKNSARRVLSYSLRTSRKKNLILFGSARCVYYSKTSQILFKEKISLSQSIMKVVEFYVFLNRLRGVPYPDAWNGKDKEVAELFAKELLASGVNLLLGPVADIHSNPANPVIGPRAFGTTSSEVSKRVVEFFQTIEAHGLRCCAKHFPGHGDTAIDSHVGLPSQSQDKEALLKRELLPFQKLIDAHISAIMTAHIVFPQIAPDKPATLAGAILTQILLEELHFSGVVISDSLMMGAIRDMFKDPHIPAAALQAGCDIFLISEERDPSILPFAMEIATALSNSMRKDPKIAQKVEETVSRVQAWRKTLPPFHVHELSSTVFAIHHALSAEILNHFIESPAIPKTSHGELVSEYCA
jgi:beta-N-acetylhexosaminidase